MKPEKLNRYPLTEEQFEVLKKNQDWQIHELSPQEFGPFPNLPRRNDVVAVFASGDLTGTKLLNGVQSVAGMDVIAREERPNLEQEEPELNIYHCVFQKLAQPRGSISYVMHGPSRLETLFGHWKDEAVLDEYIEAAKTHGPTICEKRIEPTEN